MVVFVSAWCGIIPPRYRRWCSAACFAAVVLLSFPSRFSFRSAARFASLRHSPRPATRWAGRCLAVGVIGLCSSPVLLFTVRGVGRRVRITCYHLRLYRRAGALCGLCGLAACLPFLWYIDIVNWLYISFDWIFDMTGLPAATVIGFELSLIDNSILIEIGGGELPILPPDQSIKYAGLAASRIADFVLEHDYRIPNYLKAADFLDICCS